VAALNHPENNSWRFSLDNASSYLLRLKVPARIHLEKSPVAAPLSDQACRHIFASTHKVFMLKLKLS
jgi:hypothetical protein